MTTQIRLFVFLVSGVLLLGFLWILLSELIVPSLIESAYRGESVAMINSMISGQDTAPMEHYLNRWEKITRRVNLILLLSGTVFLVIGYRTFQSPGRVSSGRMGMDAFLRNPQMNLEKRRLWLVYALLALLVGGSLYDMVTRIEHWPFSPYPMFSGVRRDRSLNVLRLFGVIEGNLGHEIPLVKSEYIHPMDEARLRVGLRWITRSNHRQQLLREALQDSLMRYESLRREGRHDGPPLQGIRLYRVYWKLDPWARNVERPDHRDLVFEVMRPEKKAS